MFKPFYAKLKDVLFILVLLITVINNDETVKIHDEIVINAYH